MERFDAIVVGGGLAGLVAAAELADRGRGVALVDQEPPTSLGGQAFWSFGGLFLVDSPEQRRMRVSDSAELALADWLGSAGFDRPEDRWPRRWAEAYVEFAAGEKREWLHGQGVRWLPFVQWAERGGYPGSGHGNSVPRFHITWGTGPGIIEPFVRRVRAAEREGKLTLRHRHRVVGLLREGAAVSGVRCERLAPSDAGRGEPSGREVVDEVELGTEAVLICSGGIGHDFDRVREIWPRERAGEPPAEMLAGVPDHVDGAMIDVAASAGAELINTDRMWNYPEGVRSPEPVWSNHGIRILPGPSSLWLDADGERLPPPLFPGFDGLGSLAHITRAGHDHSWLVLNDRILETEIALSGSEQNPDLTGKDLVELAKRVVPGVETHVERFARACPDIVTAADVPSLARRMNELSGTERIDPAALARTIELRDRQVETGLGKDPQLAAIVAARRYLADRVMRVAKPHRLTDPDAAPLVAIHCRILTRKTLGGIHTDLDARVLDSSGEPIPGLWAAGEAAGFGGGGYHGYRALEGTFLGGCIFSGRVAGRAAARATSA